jgi:uncharacterized protein (DUF1330 family)
MKCYAIVEIEITDQSWVPAYVKNVTRMVEERGGRFLARTSKIDKVEGTRNTPQIVTIIEWPSREIAQAFYESDEYRPCREARLAGSANQMLLIAGEDIIRHSGIFYLRRATLFPVFPRGHNSCAVA